jgi:hypothetical protein
VSREEYPFYHLTTRRAQNAALKEIKLFIRSRLLKIRKKDVRFDPDRIDRWAERLIDVLKPSFSRRGSILHYSTLDEYTPVNDIRVLRKIYARCIT